MSAELYRKLSFFESSVSSWSAENNHREKSYSECERRGEQIAKLAEALFASVSLLLCYKTTLTNL